jgi:hypothetical protein
MKLLGYAIAAFASCSPMQDHVRLSTHSFVAMECSRSRRLFLKHQSSFLGGLTTLGLPWLMIDHTEAMTTDPKTGISLPSEGDIEASIPVDWNDADNPFGDDTPQTLFSRLDASPDSLFYAEPRFVEHVDAAAVQTLTDYISKEALHKGDCVLDLCSSWTSHINVNQATSLKRVAGLGMNAKELSANSALTDWIVRDLNQNPQLPYEDNSFDVVLCQLSIDYLTQPKQVLKEVSRVLKPGAMIHVLFSNRLFLSKV